MDIYAFQATAFALCHMAVTSSIQSSEDIIPPESTRPAPEVLHASAAECLSNRFTSPIAAPACEMAMSLLQLMLDSSLLPFAGPDKNRIFHHGLCECGDQRTGARVSHPWRHALHARDYQRDQQRQDPGLQLGGGGQHPSVSTHCTWIYIQARLWKSFATAGEAYTSRHATCLGGASDPDQGY